MDEEHIGIVSEFLGITHPELLEIEKNTRKQASCDQWYQERKIRLTASNFGAVIKRRRTIYPKSLLQRIQNQSKDSKCPKPCQWGKDNEEKAINKYLKLKHSQGQSVKLCSKCGFIVNPVFPWLGASPDFLVSDMQETSLFGICEIKCSFSKKDSCIEQACEDPNFFLDLSNGKVSLKKKHAYYYQLHGVMATLQLQWSDFVVFTNKDLHVERVYFDQDFWEKTMLPELNSFYFKYLLPCLKLGKV